MGVGNQDETAFAFEGDWAEYFRIAGPNLLLTFATLGIYRFWATTRERQYLWSKTRFIDDNLEWTGTGKELLIGFILAVVLVSPFLLFVNVFFQRMLLNNQSTLAFTIFTGLYIFLLYLGGFARFRALRYRLSRTYWHGIHGGSDGLGFKYGWSYLWKYVVGYLPAGLLLPWAMADLWRERWSQMSFGPLTFVSEPRWTELMKRYLLFYLSPILIILGGALIAGPMALIASMFEDSMIAGVVASLGAVIGVYGALGLIALAFYAKFFREGVGTLSLGKLEFEFTARTKDWLKFTLVTVLLYAAALAVAFAALLPFGISDGIQTYFETAGQGSSRLAIIGVGVVAAIAFGIVGAINQFRNWRFFIRYLEAGGEVDLGELTQSKTKKPGEGEGLMDAFDMGAI